MISRGGEPIYIKNLKKKYKISKAINVPTNWDSPPFVYIPFPKCDSTTRTYQLYNDFVDKYMNLTKFNDTFISKKNFFNTINKFFPGKYLTETILNYMRKNFKNIESISFTEFNWVYFDTVKKEETYFL